MPELPEVEVTRRRIEPLLVGRTIASVRTTGPSYFYLTDPALLAREIRGRAVQRLERIGKYLLGALDDGRSLLLHLGMTGQLFSSEASSVRLLSAAHRAALEPGAQRGFVPDEHTHLVLGFRDGGPRVQFRDVRKFGKVALLAAGEQHPRLARLGADALGAQGGDLFERSRGRVVAVKQLLLDQAFLAGVGNIYADEALHLAGVRPTRRAGRVTREEWDRIAQGVRQVLLRSIEAGGSSIDDFVAPDGSDGAYQLERRVYARTGEPCPSCSAVVRRVVLAQRSAHYCPRCQH
jgi:formamidopyrimidine-DNA glycosylase